MISYKQWCEYFDKLQSIDIPENSEELIEYEELSDLLKQQVGELYSTMDDLEWDNDHLNNEIDSLNEDIDDLERYILVLEGEHDKAKYDNEKLDEQLKFDEFLEMFGMFEEISYHKFIKIINEIKQTYSSNKINKLYDANDNSSTGM